MKLEGTFFTELKDIIDNKKTYLSVIPAYNNYPKKICPVLSYDTFFMSLKDEKGETMYYTKNPIHVINERLNFTNVVDADAMLIGMCGIEGSFMVCKLSDIEAIESFVDAECELILNITFTNGNVVYCREIEFS